MKQPPVEKAVLVPEVLAVASAFCMALSSMFLSELKGRVPLLQLARWQMLAVFLMTGLVSLVLGGWRTIGLWQVSLLAASSLVGVMIASTTCFAALYSFGPRITALLFALTSPFALALGYLAFGETIDIRQGLGAAIILCGVFLAIGAPRRFFKAGASLRATPSAAPVVKQPAVSLCPPRIRRCAPGLLSAS